MRIADIWSNTLFPDLTDYVIIGVYLILIFLFANSYKNKRIESNPEYKFFTLALFAKVIGALAMGLIYTLYYDGGDTTAYYRSSEAVVNVLFKEPHSFFKVLFSNDWNIVTNSFTVETGYPGYIGKWTSFIVIRITSIFTLLGFKNYFTSTLLFACFFHIGYWKLFRLAVKLYPAYITPFAISILFFPSVLFWGSGISKDAIALSMTGLFIYSTYMVFVEKRKLIPNIFSLILSAFFILTVKAYIFVALVPGVFIYLAWSYLKKIDNPVFRFIATPLTGAVFLAAGLGLLALFAKALGEYGSIDGIIRKAIITYEDHTRAQAYGENFYSLGSFDGTRWDFFRKAPLAIMAGLFRPYLWEARNPVMLLAAIENTAFLLMTLIILWRTGPIKALKITLDEPLVIFSLSFAVVFAFAVGIATANFGALVRLKIPLIPFLAAGLFTLYRKSMELKAGKENLESKNFVALR